MRFAVATGVWMMIAGLCACSGKADDAEGEKAVNPPGTTGAEAGADPLCAFFESEPARVPDLGPAACKRCAAAKCCVQITKCHGAELVGAQTKCQTFGACDLACNGDRLCEAKCQIDHGDDIADDWYASEGCIHGTAPAGCADFCS